MVDPGYQVFAVDRAVVAWAQAAYTAAQCLDTTARRHGGTWFVGVDALPNTADGAVAGVPFPLSSMAQAWHAAQVSIVYDGYPRQDSCETDAAHQFRLKRDAAHMDGLLPEGPDKRRHLREPHAFIIGIALNAATASPLVVWEGSHQVMRTAFATMYDGIPPENYGDIDVTQGYQAARKTVFETCRRTRVPTRVGEVVVLHRHLIHGVAAWDGTAPQGEGRMIAYFRPIGSFADWL